MKWKSIVHRLRYFLFDAVEECRRSPGVNLIAALTLTSVLFLAGLVMLVLSNIERHVEGQRGDVRVEIYLRDDIAEEVRTDIERQVAALEGVERVEYVDKAEALRRYRQWPSNMADLIDELDSNPLPASLEVFLVDGPGADATADRIAAGLANAEGIEAVQFDRELLARLEQVLEMARLGGTVLAVLVFSAVVFVMASVLRLAVYARRDEIEIMLLVGATPAFVSGPFLVAGLGQGLGASLLSLIVVEIARLGALAGAGPDSAALLSLLVSRGLPFDRSLLLVLLGLVVSFCGSYFAVRRSLKPMR